MKNTKLSFVVAGAVLSVLLLAGCADAPKTGDTAGTTDSSGTTVLDTTTVDTTKNPSKRISETEAKRLALEHAQVQEADAKFVTVKLDQDGIRSEYEVEFYVGNKEYDYEIDAETGEIISVDYEIEGQIPTTGSTPSDGNSTTLTESEATAIALKHAGVAEADVTYMRAKLDRDDGQLAYDVEFYAGNAEYDYEIHAETGAILSHDYDIEDFVPTTGGATSGGNSSAGNSTTLTESEATAVALEHAGVSEADVTYMQVKLDRDDGQLVYDVEFYAGNTEYDYEINATTGKIISYDHDFESFTPQPRSDAQISLDEAKQIALSHAGVDAAGATFKTAKLDQDDGRAEYEIEFVSGTMEYEYEILASDGSILKYDAESIYD